MTFSEKVTKFRKNKNLTQKEMAKKIGVGITQMVRYEKGVSSPTLEIIKNIAKTLEISTDELVFEEGEGIANNKILDKELLKQFEIVSNLNERDKEAVKILLESVIIKNRIEEIVPHKSDATWSQEMKSVVTELRKGANDYSEDEIDSIIDHAVKAVRGSNKNKREKIGA
jgi:transcriptional regulator with XRE-family HTH domain